MRTFPVLPDAADKRDDRLESIPWNLIESSEARVLASHGKSLAELALAGGLSTRDVLSTVMWQPPEVFAKLSDAKAEAFLRSLAGLVAGGA